MIPSSDSVHLSESVCPHCSAIFDAATRIGDSEAVKPRSGDCSICIVCGGYMQFVDDLSPLPLTEIPAVYGKDIINLFSLMQKEIRSRL